ncbi:hypothetical protein BDY24DRAFT_48257 [Mrakia frigida]|uniref:uncharacterized protein n=1 Tax=Mrakia frigida TaxID=29902 RepID=UPI003FCC0F49
MLVVNLQNGSLCNGSLGKVVAFETRYEASRDSDVELAQVRTAADEESDSDDSDDDIIATDASGTPISGPAKIKKVKNAKARIPVPPPPVNHPQIFQSSMTRPSPWDRTPAAPRDDGTPWPVVEFITGERLLMVPHDFEEQKFAKGRIIVEATRTQVPLILAWALSVHKSQGQTLTRVKIDLQRTFEKVESARRFELPPFNDLCSIFV